MGGSVKKCSVYFRVFGMVITDGMKGFFFFVGALMNMNE